MNRQKYRFIWLMARRDIVDDLKISAIVIAMLAFSFLNLTFFPAFIDGLSETFTASSIETQTGDVSIQPDDSEYLKNAGGLEEKVERLPGVREVEKRISITGQLQYKGETRTVEIIGTDSYGDEAYTSRMREGEFLRRNMEDSMVLGNSVADEEESFGEEGLGIDPGRTLTFAGENRTMDFSVIGTVGRPGPSSLTRQALISYETAEDLVGRENVASSIKILIDEKENADDFKQELQELNTRGDIKTWDERSDMTEAIDSTFAIVIAIISIVGIVIAITSIGVVIFINTSKRTREMGIVRSIGSQKSAVRRIFVLEALLFGVLGVALGNLILLSIHTVLNASPIVSPIGPISTVVTQDLLITRSAWMMAAALIAGYLPAYLVSNRGIVETIEAR
ncbi:MAG: ABC transporter permease [Candidatus Nanohaloarchaeota archaeon QJJ-7]|nr:ABC transporter permease [Candidatus Nanohaloarchaeota archaeon QJJ-7]